MTGNPRHFLDISELESEMLRGIITDAHAMKKSVKEDPAAHRSMLDGKVLAMIFDKPSTRTRVSFDVGMRQLGGETIVLPGHDLQLGRGETIADTARVLSRYVDIIMIRTTEHDRLTELAEYATVPVINGLTDDTHPCQVMTDIQTFEEHKGPINGRKLAWTGDGNNMVNSLMQASAKFDFELAIATPQAHAPDEGQVKKALDSGAKLTLTNDPQAAVAGADCVITDTWVSMGDDEAKDGHNTFAPYQVNEALMEKAAPDAIFMHCLPAHRNEEVTDGVMDGPQSVVFDEAENRLHAQKAIMAWCLRGDN